MKIQIAGQEIIILSETKFEQEWITQFKADLWGDRYLRTKIESAANGTYYFKIEKVEEKIIN